MFQTEKIAKTKALRHEGIWGTARRLMWLEQLRRGRVGGDKVRDQWGWGGGKKD